MHLKNSSLRQTSLVIDRRPELELQRRWLCFRLYRGGHHTFEDQLLRYSQKTPRAQALAIPPFVEGLCPTAFLMEYRDNYIAIQARIDASGGV